MSLLPHAITDVQITMLYNFPTFITANITVT
jgi:hypothetical protein